MADPSVKEKRQLQSQGKAMPPATPGGDPRFYIRNRGDLQNAIDAVGRVRPDTDAARAQVRRFIMKRARALNAMDMIPADWNADGSLKS
jgi:hypothetical protein